MLTIREAQMTALAKGLQDRFVARIRDTLAHDVGEDRAAREGFEATIRAGIEEAFAYGIDGEHDVTSWLRLRTKHGAGFEEAPDMISARRVLDDPDLPGGAKIASIQTALAARERESGGPR